MTKFQMTSRFVIKIHAIIFADQNKLTDRFETFENVQYINVNITASNLFSFS